MEEPSAELGSRRRRHDDIMMAFYRNKMEGEYEAKRRRRIQENQDKLRALGITPGENNQSLKPQRSSGRKRAVESISEPLVPTRRSRRLREKPVEEAGSEEDLVEEIEHRPVKRVKEVVTLDLPVASIDVNDRKPLASSMGLSIDVESFHSDLLGKQLLPSGKYTPMKAMCPSTHSPKFSRMSGIQPWANALALFVNIDSESYDNGFHQVEHTPSVYFRWFAQQRQHDESPIIRRLCDAVRGDRALALDIDTYDASVEKEKREDVLLFIRYDQGPYIYLGRLGYLGHLRAKRPLEFRWQLQDAESIDWTHVPLPLSTIEDG